MVKVKGHVNPEEASTARGRYEAIGNDFADRVARAAADAQPQPSQGELQQWAADKDLLKRYLCYVPRALSKWPSISPTVGKKSRPRLQAGHSDQEPSRGPSSFAADVLGEYGKLHARRCGPPSAPSDDAAYECTAVHLGAAPDAPPEGSSSHMQSHSQQEQPPSDHSPASSFTHRPGSRLNQKTQPPKEDEAVGEHDWIQIDSHWSCRNCMTRSRATFPPRGKCPGLTPALADLVGNPRGHILHIAPYSDGSSVILICSKCGHFAGSNRRHTKLHTSPCKGVFGSDGAKYAYKRVCERKHPTYGKGEA